MFRFALIAAAATLCLSADAALGGGVLEAPSEAPQEAAPVADGGKKKKRGNKKKPAYDFVKAVVRNADGTTSPVLNDKGQLVAIPVELKDEAGTVIQPAYTPRKFGRLKVSMFADEMLYKRYLIDLAKAKAESMAKRAARMEQELEAAIKFGDPEKRKKMEKRARILAQLKELDEELGTDGILDEDPAANV